MDERGCLNLGLGLLEALFSLGVKLLRFRLYKPAGSHQFLGSLFVFFYVELFCLELKGKRRFLRCLWLIVICGEAELMLGPLCVKVGLFLGQNHLLGLHLELFFVVAETVQARVEELFRQL